jgi:hypothetical protein
MGTVELPKLNEIESLSSNCEITKTFLRFYFPLYGFIDKFKIRKWMRLDEVFYFVNYVAVMSDGAWAISSH